MDRRTELARGAHPMLKLLPFVGYAVATAAVIAMASIGVWAGGRVATDRVPMQWGLDGEPTWYAGKRIGLWLPVIVSAFGLSMQLFAARRAASSSVPSSHAVLACTYLFLLAVYVWHVRRVMAWSAMQG